MSNFEARINTKFGELFVHFNDKNELDARLQDAKAFDLMKEIIGLGFLQVSPT